MEACKRLVDQIIIQQDPKPNKENKDSNTPKETCVDKTPIKENKDGDTHKETCLDIKDDLDEIHEIDETCDLDKMHDLDDSQTDPKTLLQNELRCTKP